MPTIHLALVICRQGEDRDKIVAGLVKCRLNPICCSNVAEARTLLPQVEFELVLCSEALRDGDYRAVLREAKKSNVQAPVIVLGHANDWNSYLIALGAGAHDFIACPPDPVEVERIICLALDKTMAPDTSGRAAA